MRNFRTYLAGLGSGGALIAAAIVGIIALGAIVGIDGLPTSSADDNSSAVIVQSNAPEIAAAASVGPDAAPAPDAAPGAAAAVAAATAPGAAPGAAPTGSGGSGSDDTLPTDPGDVPGGDGDGTDPPGLPEPPPPTDNGTNDVGGVVDEVDETVEDVTGIDAGLGDATKGITDILDGAVGGLTGGEGLGLDQVEIPDLNP
jgi:hypothetical protein